MATKSRDSILAGGFEACERLQQSDEVLRARRSGGPIQWTPAGRTGLRVLVADDWRDAADALCILVRSWGHEVRVAYDGAAALDVASAFHPCVLLLDIAMPKVDGCQLARQLRRQPRFKDALFVAITGYADEAHRLLWEEAFDHYLVKPSEPSALEQLLLLEQDRGAPVMAEEASAPGQEGVMCRA
jgi:CheY-like chemotaxis protein